MKLLTRPEELILLAVWHLQDDAYGIAIRKRLAEVTGYSWSIGAVYVPLDKLCKLGYLTSYNTPPTKVRGGRSKRYFNLTTQGRAALNEARRVHDEMWTNLPKVVLKPA